MSRFQQIRVRIEAIYPKNLAKDFPRLFQLLQIVEPLDEYAEPPLMDLVPLLVRLSQGHDLEPAAAQALDRHGAKLVELHGQVTELIGGWQLGEAEALLNQMDDLFLAFEKDLA